MNKKLIVVFFCTLLMVSAVVTGIELFPSLHAEKEKEQNNVSQSWIVLPPPEPVDMVLEKSICRRMSIRSFTADPVTDADLSTVLWAAYGRTNTGGRTVYSPNGTYSAVIYVIRSEATYRYVPENHSLLLYKTGNYLSIGQYTSPIKFGFVWNMSIASDEKGGMAEIGMICQNIYFDANALSLATVTTGGNVNELLLLGIPSNEKPEIIMPLGHPSSAYAFTYSPLPVSNLPAVVNNTMSLADVVNHRRIVNQWDNVSLSTLEQSQLLWCSYGESYNVEAVSHTRHRTLPSAIDIYPFKIFAANKTGVYQYVPSTHSVSSIVQGDRRAQVAQTLVLNNISVSSASFIIIPFLDTNVGSSTYLRWWYYETGAIAHNVFLEMTALNLTGNMCTVFSDVSGLRTALGISSQTNLVPMAVIPVGHPSSGNPNNPPGAPTISGPANGKKGVRYNYTVSATDFDGDAVSYFVDWGDGTNSGWGSPVLSGATVTVNHTWVKRGTYTVKAKARDEHGAEGAWGTLQVTMPTSLSWSPFLKIMERFPHLFPFLRSLLN